MVEKELEKAAARYVKNNEYNFSVLAAHLTNMVGEFILIDTWSVGSIVESAAWVLLAQKRIKDADEWTARVLKRSGFLNDDSIIIEEDEPLVLTIVPTAPVVVEVDGRKGKGCIYRTLLERCFEIGMTQKEIVNKIVATFPGLNRASVGTAVTDSKNPRYSKFGDRRVIEISGKKLIFEDCIAAQQTAISLHLA